MKKTITFKQLKELVKEANQYTHVNAVDAVERAFPELSSEAKAIIAKWYNHEDEISGEGFSSVKEYAGFIRDDIRDMLDGAEVGPENDQVEKELTDCGYLEPQVEISVDGQDEEWWDDFPHCRTSGGQLIVPASDDAGYDRVAKAISRVRGEGYVWDTVKGRVAYTSPSYEKMYGQLSDEEGAMIYDNLIKQATGDREYMKDACFGHRFIALYCPRS